MTFWLNGYLSVYTQVKPVNLTQVIFVKHVKSLFFLHSQILTKNLTNFLNDNSAVSLNLKIYLQDLILGSQSKYSVRYN